MTDALCVVFSCGLMLRAHFKWKLFLQDLI